MIINRIKFNNSALRFIKTFDGKGKHWDGSCAQRTTLRGSIRRHYLKEQKYCCAYCGRIRQDKHGFNWDIDHIIPKSTHPLFTYEPKNYAVTCKECNINKDDQNVLSHGIDASKNYPFNKDDFLIINPHLDEFKDHISIFYTYEHKVYHKAITQKGIETFKICGLGRFTEELAGTGVYIEEKGVTIGFFDDKFKSIYDQFQDYVASFTQDPQLRKQLFANYLAKEADMKTDELLNAINKK